MGVSPTQRTLKYLRDLGYVCAIAEHWNPHAKIRQDLFGWVDIVALNDQGIAGVQTTSTPNMAARSKKIRSLPAFEAWRKAGGIVLVIGWSKRGPRGGRKVWTPKCVRLFPNCDLDWSLEEAP